MKRAVIFACGNLLLASPLWAANCQSNGNGNWSVPATWSCNQVPTAADTVTVRNGNVVTLDGDTAAITALTVTSGSTLAGAGAHTLNLAGNLNVNGSGAINLPAATLALAANSEWGGSASATAISLAEIDLNFKTLNFTAGVDYTIALYGATPLSKGNSSLFNTTTPSNLVTIQMAGGNQSWGLDGAIYPNLQISGSGTKTYASSSLVVRGSLSIDAGASFNAASATGSNQIGGDLLRFGTFTVAPNSGTWNFNGTAGTQTITGGAAFTNMTVSNSSGVTLVDGDLTAGNSSNGSLALTGGNVITGSNRVIVPTPCQSNIVSGSGWINGNQQLTFPGHAVTCVFRVGDSARAASITLNIPFSGGVGSFSGLTLTGSTTSGDHPNIATSGLNAARSVNRYWTLGRTGDTLGCVPYGGDQFNVGSYTAAFQFSSADRDSGTNTSQFKVGRYFGGWAAPAVATAAATSTSIKVVTTSGSNATFGTYAVAEQTNFMPPGNGPANYCSVDSPIADWRMDEASWNGTTNEVKDSSGNGFHGTAAYANGSGPPPTTGSINRAYTSGTESTCNYGQFTSSLTPDFPYVELPAFPALPDAFTFTAWIKSSNVGASGQRIVVHDDAQNGWGFSVGDAASGTLRFFNRNIQRNGNLLSGSGSNSACGTGASDPLCVDTNAVLSSNNWYFVAVAVDKAAKRVTLYVFNQSGTLLAQPSSAYSGTWSDGGGKWALGGETRDSAEGTQSAFHFKGQIDEVSVYLSALTQSALQTILTRVRTCPSTAVNHYELRLPASSLACMPNQVTVAACADSAVPCSNYVSSIGGQSALLATSGGAALDSSTVTFSGAGLASTQLRYPAASDGTPVTLTLSNETLPAQAARVCCVGSTCTTASSCTTTFNTAGFIVSDVANGAAVSMPGQIAGRSSGNYSLRAVRTSTTTKACEAALTGTSSVDFAYECDGNPSTCDGNRMSVTGIAAQAVPGNNNDSVTNFQTVNLNFDADGNAPFSFTYGDVGQIILHARKAAGGALLAPLTGSTNVFAVKPYDFSVTNLDCAGTGNPAAADASGGKFCAAGNDFSLRVTARAQGGATTPSFGRCDSSGGTGCAAAAEVVTLTHTLRAPLSGSSGNLGGTLTKNASTFANGPGFATFSNLNWNEVGIINLRAANGNYLSNNRPACSATPLPGDDCRGTYGDSGNAGRFYPQHFKIKLTPICGSFVYAGHTEAGPAPVLGQPFSVEVAAKYGSGDAQVTTNYSSQLGFAKNVNLTLDSSGLNAGGVSGDLYVGSSKGGSNAIPATKFTSPGVGVVNHDEADLSKRISYVFNAAAPQAPPPAIPAASSMGVKVLTLHADDADTATSAATGNATVGARLGRLRLSNAFGSEKLPLRVPLQVQYWTGDVWVLNNLDSCTELKPEHFHLSSALSSVSTTPNPIKINGGNGGVVLTAPGAGNTGSVDVAANLGMSGSDQSCLATHGATAGLQPWLRSRNGGCAATYNRDPSARATFGIYSPESRRLIHVREFY